MKRRILEAFLLMAVLSAAAVAAQAAQITSGTSIGSLGFTPGNKVTVTAFSDTGTPTAPGDYAASSMHSTGSRTYGVNSASTRIYFIDGISGHDVDSATATFGTDWTSM